MVPAERCAQKLNDVSRRGNVAEKFLQSIDRPNELPVSVCLPMSLTMLEPGSPFQGKHQQTIKSSSIY